MTTPQSIIGEIKAHIASIQTLSMPDRGTLLAKLGELEQTMGAGATTHIETAAVSTTTVGDPALERAARRLYSEIGKMRVIDFTPGALDAFRDLNAVLKA